MKFSPGCQPPLGRRSGVWAAFALGLLGYPSLLHASVTLTSVEFNPDFLRSPVDTRLFADGNPLPGGHYKADLYVNDEWKGHYTIRFEPRTPNARIARPCYDLSLLELLGLDIGQIHEGIRTQLRDQDVCEDLETILPHTHASFDSSDWRLDVTAPQAMLLRHARGYVNPELWDQGVTAGTLQYHYNAYHSAPTHSASTTSHYLSLNGGLNIGAWRFRYRSSAMWGTGQRFQYQGYTAYAQRALAAWRSTLTIGEATTGGHVLDSVNFRGVQLASDDRMYADSQRGFAPVVRGIANSNALVRIRQRDLVIYEVTVPPGPFVIDDLYPSGSGGDLEVTVTEADGSERRFTVAYAATAELLRPGVTRYSLTLGRYHNTSVDERPMLASFTLQHGFSNSITGYSGGIVANRYKAFTGGIAVNTALGALSADVTHARTTDSVNQTYQGKRLRLSYAKILPVVGTSVSVSTEQYSRYAYYLPTDAFLLQDHRYHGVAFERPRQRWLVHAAQTLPAGYGSLSLSASRTQYWTSPSFANEYAVHYNTQWGRMSLGLSAHRTRNLFTQAWDNQIMLSLSMPFGSGIHTPHLTASYSRSRDQQAWQAGVNGSAGADHQFRYNAYASLDKWADSPHRKTVGIGGSWTAPLATVSANASRGHEYQQYGLNLSGGIVAYAGGVVFTPQLGDTIAIVRADNAEGARVSSYTGVRLDRSGQAVVPYLNPYRLNAVEIDPKGISTDVQLHSTSQRTAPTAGAVVLLRFETETGYSMLLNGHLPSGEPLPFAAAIHDAHGHNVGYVSQGGQAILRVADTQGTLWVSWGDASEQRCQIRYAFDVDTATDSLGYRPLAAQCVVQD